MARPKKNAESTSPWGVRDVPEDTRRKVRVYAAQHDLTMAQAIEELVNSALGHNAQPFQAAERQPSRPEVSVATETAGQLPQGASELLSVVFVDYDKMRDGLNQET